MQASQKSSARPRILIADGATFKGNVDMDV